jgi:hypothetical protein
MAANRTVDYYLSELGRAQTAYKTDYKDNPTLQKNAADYGQRLRQEAQAAGYDLSQYGTKNQHGIDYTQYHAPTNGVSAGAYNPQTGQVRPEYSTNGGNQVTQQKPAVMTQEDFNRQLAEEMQSFRSGEISKIQELFRNTVDGVNNQNSALKQQILDQSKRQSEAIAKQKQDALSSLINNLKTNQETALSGINNSVEDAKQGLEDRTFQQYLAARQQMANRGLAGSGIASDQDTRLLLQKQRDLAGIYRDASTRQAGVTGQFTNQLSDAQRQLAGINSEEIGADIFSKLYESGNKALMDKAGLYQKYLGDLMGYDIDSQKNQFDYDKLSAEQQQFYDKLSSEEQQFYDKLTQTGQIEEAKLALNLKKHNLDVAKLMGTDENGNPTIDARKLYEQMRHNQASESISWSNVANNQARLNETIRRNGMKAAEFLVNYQGKQLEGKVSTLTDIMKSKGDQLKRLVDLKASGQGGEDIDNQIRNAGVDYAAAVASLEKMSGVDSDEEFQGVF